ncbi:MAG: hypothetical protein M1281_09885 [Chloroflexi bacterium]|nr:hypothetical protein [Chloroflexota bacterium]
MFKGIKKPGDVFMNRKEVAVWLGRAMSTNDIILRTLLKMLPIMMYQQHAILTLLQHERRAGDEEFNSGPPKDKGEEAPPPPQVSSSDGQGDLSKDDIAKILEKLTEIETDLTPVAKMVDQACADLQKMI